MRPKVKVVAVHSQTDIDLREVSFDCATGRCPGNQSVLVIDRRLVILCVVSSQSCGLLIHEVGSIPMSSNDTCAKHQDRGSSGRCIEVQRFGYSAAISRL